MDSQSPQKGEFKKFKKECLNDDGWDLVHSHKSCIVYTKKVENYSYNAIKVKSQYPDIDPETLYNVLHDHDYRKVWDKNMIEGKVIEMLQDDVEIGYYLVRLGYGISNRDFCNMRTWRVKDNEWIIFNRSVISEKCPEVKGCVRGQSIKSGYYIKKLEEGTEFIYYSHCDPKGWLPVYIVNWIMDKLAPNMIKTLHKVTLEYPEWLESKKNDDVQKEEI